MFKSLASELPGDCLACGSRAERALRDTLLSCAAECLQFTYSIKLLLTLHEGISTALYTLRYRSLLAIALTLRDHC